jgi:hypothetical protein
MNRVAEAVMLIESGMRIAAITDDREHEIRLQLALALAYGNGGDVERSQQAAERAEKPLSVTAWTRLPPSALDLGNVYSQKGEPDAAERYCKRAGLGEAGAGAV